MVAAVITRIGRPAFDPVVFGDPLADLAVDALGVQILAQPFEAGFVAGEVPLEVADGVPLHRALGLLSVGHVPTLATVCDNSLSYLTKGIITPSGHLISTTWRKSSGPWRTRTGAPCLMPCTIAMARRSASSRRRYRR